MEISRILYLWGEHVYKQMNEVATLNRYITPAQRKIRERQKKTIFKRNSRHYQRADVTKVMAFSLVVIKKMEGLKGKYNVWDIILLCCADVLMRKAGHFTLKDVRDACGISSANVMAWKRKMLSEGCIIVQKGARINQMKHFISQYGNSVIYYFNRTMSGFLSEGVVSCIDEISDKKKSRYSIIKKKKRKRLRRRAPRVGSS